MGEKVPALVFGRGLTLLGVLRALGSARIPVWVAATARDYVRWSRWHRCLPGAACRSADTAVLAEDLARIDLARAVLFPCNDSAASAIAGLQGALAERFPASVAPVTGQRVCTDKLLFAATLERLSIPHPTTREIETVDALAALPHSAFEDVFLKPRHSERFSQFYDVKAFPCRDREDALESCGRALADGHPLVLQEFIPGPPTAHHFVDGFVDREGHVRALFARQRIRMEPPHFGNSTSMRSIALDDVRSALDGLRRFLADIRYRGVFSAEFKRDPRDGLFKIIEVNSRPWWYVGFARACGVDVCRLAYLDALGEPVPSIDGYRIGRTCVYPHMDAKAYLRERRSGGPGAAKVLGQWFGAVQPVFAWNDPGPGVGELIGIAGSTLRRLVRGAS